MKKLLLVLISVFLFINNGNAQQTDDYSKRFKELWNSIKVLEFKHNVNSAGGVDVDIQFSNISQKTIKYVTFKIGVFNRVFDRINCTITHKNYFEVLYTGPLNKGATDKKHWDPSYYNKDTYKAFITGVNIEYMDGAKLDVKGDELMLIQGKTEYFWHK